MAKNKTGNVRITSGWGASVNQCCRGKAKNITYLCVCVRACVCPGAWVHVALFIQNATRMRHIVTSFVVPLAPSYYSTLSDKRYDFQKKKKKLLNIKVCLDFLCNFFWNISYSKKNLSKYCHKREIVLM